MGFAVAPPEGLCYRLGMVLNLDGIMPRDPPPCGRCFLMRERERERCGRCFLIMASTFAALQNGRGRQSARVLGRIFIIDWCIFRESAVAQLRRWLKIQSLAPSKLQAHTYDNKQMNDEKCLYTPPLESSSLTASALNKLSSSSSSFSSPPQASLTTPSFAWAKILSGCGYTLRYRRRLSPTSRNSW